LVVGSLAITQRDGSGHTDVKAGADLGFTACQ
jgi:hypothetical protein